jgi:hypothetical protein
MVLGQYTCPTGCGHHSSGNNFKLNVRGYCLINRTLFLDFLYSASSVTSDVKKPSTFVAKSTSGADRWGSIFLVIETPSACGFQ